MNYNTTPNIKKGSSHIGTLRANINDLINKNQWIIGGHANCSRNDSDYDNIMFIRESIDIFDFLLIKIKNIINNMFNDNSKNLQVKSILLIITEYLKCIKTQCDVLVNEFETSIKFRYHGDICCNLENYIPDIQEWIDEFTTDINDIIKEEEEELEIDPEL